MHILCESQFIRLSRSLAGGRSEIIWWSRGRAEPKCGRQRSWHTSRAAPSSKLSCKMWNPKLEAIQRYILNLFLVIYLKYVVILLHVVLLAPPFLRLQLTVKKIVRLAGLTPARKRRRSRSILWEGSHSSKHRKENRSFFSQRAKSCSGLHVLRSRRAHPIRIGMVQIHQSREQAESYLKRCCLWLHQPVRWNLLFRVCTEVTLTHSPD